MEVERLFLVIESCYN